MRLLTLVLAAVAASPAPVSIVGRMPTLQAGRARVLVLRAPRAPVLVARHASQTRRFHAKRRGRGRFAATISLSSPGTWSLSAVLGRRRYRLGSLRVVAAAYQLSVPSQLVADPDGSLLVAERGSRFQVTRIDPSSGRVSVFSALPVEPYGLAWNGERLLVTTHAGIYAVPAHGGRARLVDTADVGPLVPTGSSAFYGNESQIGRLDLASGATTPLPTAVSNPHTLVLDSAGRLLVADTGTGRVLAVDPATGAATTLATGLVSPVPLAIGANGDVLVGEHDTGNLVRIAPGGGTSILARGLQKPYSIAVAPDGDYYVTEVGDVTVPSGRLVRVTRAGRVSVVRLRR
jgi:sugar lactone lactonase YvrE